MSEIRVQSKAQQVFLYFNYVLLTITCLTCLLPFINLLAISFSDTAAVSANRVAFWPVNFTLGAYQFAFGGGRFLAALWISVKRVLLGVVVNMLLLVLTAYPLSLGKEKLMGRNIYMGFFVVTMILSGGVVPIYITVSQLHLLNTMWSLVLPGALPVFSMIILMNFIRSLPEELQDAAMIDGAGPVKTLVYVLLPLLKPCLATVGLFSIVFHWNDWFSGMIYMQDYMRYPLQTYLQYLLLKFSDLMKMAGGDYAKIVALLNVRTGRAAQLFLGALPMALIYPFLQKYFTSGLVMGSVKG